MDTETIKIAKQSLTSTKSKVKFMGEIFREFEIKTVGRHGDGLSLILFNCALEKVLRTRKGEFAGIKNDVRIGAKNDKIVVDCLAFADDLAIITEDEDIAQRYIEKLQEVSAKAGLQISLLNKTNICLTIGITEIN